MWPCLTAWEAAVKENAIQLLPSAGPRQLVVSASMSKCGRLSVILPIFSKGAKKVTHQHNPTTTEPEAPSQIFHPRFAAFYERYGLLASERRLTDPPRQETAGQAYGAVLEVGAGSGLNFSWYHPERVERVEAIEPDAAMLAYARERVRQAAVPISLTQASVESLPFADAALDSVVVSLVFCSVREPAQGMQE